jgi:hypothetical protein
MSARKVRRRPRRARNSGAVASPQHTEDYVTILSTPEDQEPEDLREDRLRFGKLDPPRSARKQVRQRFIDKAERTSRRKRRWFCIKDIEPDEAARVVLLKHWRASIWSCDLMLRNKSQVLCLSVSPLMENNRLPPEFARGEHFYMIVDDLWMSAPRWLQWFGQVSKTPPAWLAFLHPEPDAATPVAMSTGTAGRPTSKHLLLKEMERRWRTGEMLAYLSREAAYLLKWLVEMHPTSPQPTAGSIENAVRARFRELRSTPSAASGANKSAP